MADDLIKGPSILDLMDGGFKEDIEHDLVVAQAEEPTGNYRAQPGISNSQEFDALLSKGRVVPGGDS